jgi:hypothetical protein
VVHQTQQMHAKVLLLLSHGAIILASPCQSSSSSSHLLSVSLDQL